MAGPLQQRTAPPRDALVRLCQWLWKQRGFIWGTVICGVVFNLFASWLITPSGSTFSNTPLGILLGHPLFSALVGLSLLVLTGGLWLVNRQNPAPAAQNAATLALSQHNREAVVRLLRQEYNKRLTQSLQGAAVPVILNLSSWASKKPPLAAWLIDQLRLVYGIPSRLSQTLLEQEQWLLLLDGLDEVEASARSQCIEAINRYREEHFVPLIVCSRSHEYEAQEARLALSSNCSRLRSC